MEKSARPIFGGDKRKHIVSQVMEIMADWRLSPFEHEGACRTGLRSALCLEGHSWQRADDEAASIIETCLKGHRRPTWLQGQPEGADRENCLGCGKLIDTSERQLRRVSYCSDLCRIATKIRCDEADLYTGAKVTMRAFYLRGKEQRGRRECGTCGEWFRPSSDEVKYCSQRCAQHARPDRIAEKLCAVCCTPFRPSDRLKAGKYCSKSCADKGKAKRPERRCDHCSKVYRQRHSNHLYCSRECISAALPARQCAHCGTLFRPSSGTRAIYCTVSCRNAANYLKAK